MDNAKIDLSTLNNWNNNPDWATDEEWVRAAANLEAETEIDILIGAYLGNNLDFSDKNTTLTQSAKPYDSIPT